MEYDFQKSRVTGSWDHKDSVSAKKVKKKISCLCTFKRMLSLILRSAVPSKHSEHTHQGLMRTLIERVRNWCVRWAYASGTDAHAEHTHQFITRILSISVKIPNLKRAFKPCWAYASGIDVCTWHARKKLMRMLRYASAPYAYAQLAHQKLNEAWLPQKLK
jgi:hypothetical protein